MPKFLNFEFEWDTFYTIAYVPQTSFNVDFLINKVYPIVQGYVHCQNCFVDQCMRVGLVRDSAVFYFDDEEYEGTFLYRFAKYQELIDQPLPNSVRSELKSVLSDFAPSTGRRESFIQFANKIDWQPGDFYEYDSSCWWNGYADGRASFEWGMLNGECAAIKIYDADKRPIGRCFVMLNEGSPILFNFYCREFSNQDFYKIMQSHFKAYNRVKVELEIRGHHNAIVYVNDNHGYILSNEDTFDYDYFFNLEYPEAIHEIEERKFAAGTTAEYCCQCQRKYVTYETYNLRPYKGKWCLNCVREFLYDITPYSSPLIYRAKSRTYYDPRYYKSKYVGGVQKIFRIKGVALPTEEQTDVPTTN